MRIAVLLAATILLLPALWLLRGGDGRAGGGEHVPPGPRWDSPFVPPDLAEHEIAGRRELPEGTFPCTDCHDPDMLETNPERRELSIAHQDVALRHGRFEGWCLDCHDADDRDHLRLAGGTLVPFEESHRLCAQCHGAIVQDWIAGAHGRRTGLWDGRKTYQHCDACHDPHAPHFEPIAPEPAPKPPVRTP